MTQRTCVYRKGGIFVKKCNWLLFACLLLSVWLCVWAAGWDIRLLLVLPALPCGLGQLWLCRVTGDGSTWRGLLPGLAFLWTAAGLMFSLISGWDGVLGLIMLSAIPAPAAGMGLGWYIAHRWEREAKRGDG